MKTKDVTAILKKQGWKTYRDDANDSYARYHFPDRIVSMGYKVRSYGGGEGSLELWMVELTTAPYCLAWEYYMGEKRDPYEDQLISTKEEFGITAPDLSESHVEAALNKVLAWAQAQDIEQILREKAHSLVAKVLLGDVEALKRNMSTPQILVPEFSDYKTITDTERLLIFAQAYKNGELADVLAGKKPKNRLMSPTAVKRALKIQGWFVVSDLGDMWLSLPDRFVLLKFGFVHLLDKYNVHIKAGISTEEISKAYCYIYLDRKYSSIPPTAMYTSFITIGGSYRGIFEEGIDICVKTLNEQEVSKISDRVIQWAHAQDLVATIESKTLIQKYSFSQYIVWHLACLALMGKIDVLKSYQNFIAAGTIAEHLDSMNAETYVNRAVEFAEDHLKILNERKAKDASLGAQALAVFDKIDEQLKAIGWTVYRDKNYERNAYFLEKDRLINIVYSLNTEGETPLIACKASFSTLGFSTAHREIFLDMPQYTPLKEADDVYKLSYSEIEAGKLNQTCTDILSWANQQNVNQIIYDYAALPTNSDYELAVHHLIALVLIGDVEKLKFYMDSFNAGNRLGFAEGITQSLINQFFYFTRYYRSDFPKNTPLLSLDQKTAPVDEASVDGVSADVALAGEASANEASVEGVPSDEASADEDEEGADEADDAEETLTMESAKALFQSLGWSVETLNDEGDHLAIYQLADREVELLYNDEIIEDCPQFDSGLLIETGILTTACKMIDPSFTQELPDLELNFEAKGLEIFDPEVSADYLKKVLHSTLEWAVSEIDLAEDLRSDYGTPPWQREKSATGKANDARYALQHIGALALLGDVETLQFYHKSFSAKDRLGFDESIQQIHLERAIVIAKAVAESKQLSYALLEQVEKSLPTHSKASQRGFFRFWKKK
ncbi:DUF6990 domain-containing protein [Bartonella sp. B30(2025)]